MVGDTTHRNGNAAPDFLIRALRKHWLLGVVFAVGVFAAVAFYTVGQKRIYRASAVVLIEPNPPRPLGNNVQAVVETGAGSFWSNKEYYSTQYQILQGRALARETVKALNLHLDPTFIKNVTTGTKVNGPIADPNLENATSALLSRLVVEPVKESRLVSVLVNDADRNRAHKILSTLLDIYLERNIDTVVASTSAAADWLRSQTDKLKSELEQTEMALHDYKKDKKILSVSLDDQSNMLRGEMQALNETLTHAGAKREQILARVREIDKIDPSNPVELPASELLQNGLLNTLRQEYVRAKTEVDSLIQGGKGEHYPEVESARARVEAAREAVLAEIRNVQGALRADLAAITTEEKGLSGLFARAKTRALDLNMLEIEYRRLERSKENTEKLYGLVLERSKESDLTRMLRFNNITLAEPPSASVKPVRPRVPLNLAVGFVLGIALGLGLIVARESLDRTVRTPDDLEEELGIPMLGLLPALTAGQKQPGYYGAYGGRSRRKRGQPVLNTPELVAHELPKSNAAECARGIRTSLTFSSPDKPYKTILVTSGSPGEGKTTVASTIAVTFAQAEQRILLVDCDLRRARLHRIFKVANAAGVSSAVSDPSSLEAAAVSTSVPNLFLLPAGPHVPNPAEIVQSAAFGALLDAMKGKFDRIVLDSPPILPVTDATVLATRVDATVVVLRARSTRRETARQIVRKLGDLGATVAGVVLNAFEARRRKSGYYYYYGHYSKEGYGKEGYGSEGLSSSQGEQPPRSA